MLSSKPRSGTSNTHPAATMSETEEKTTDGSTEATQKPSNRRLFKEHEALLKEQETWERARQAKREARAAARAQRQEQKGPGSRSELKDTDPMRVARSSSILSIGSTGASSLIDEELQGKYHEVCRTVAELQASKTALVFELNQMKDRNEDLSEDLSHANALTRKAKAHVVSLNRTIELLLQKQNEKINEHLQLHPQPQPQPEDQSQPQSESESQQQLVDNTTTDESCTDDVPPTPVAAAVTMVAPTIITVGIPIDEHEKLKLAHAELATQVLELLAKINQLEKEAEVATETAAKNKDLVQDQGLPPIDEMTSAHRLVRLEAQVKRLTSAKQAAEQAEDEAQREMRKVARDSRRLTAKVSALELEKESLQAANDRLRNKDKRSTLDKK
eukprot:m.53129 g.53129  ORF g.53129 m.53129 type:complete len:388 (-) comp21714_c0_seq1:78-1241(-)